MDASGNPAGRPMPRKTSKPKNKPPAAADLTYWGWSKQPLASLIFLMPLLIAYELGVMIYATDYAHGTAQHIYARSLLSEFFAWFGVTTHFLPGLVVVVLLLSWHIVSGARWEWNPPLYLAMAAEALLLAVPLFVLMKFVGRHVELQALVPALAGRAPPGAVAGLGQAWQADLVFSIGAGIYEELLFRVIVIALVHWLLVDWLELDDLWGSLLTVLASAVLFALYHFSAQNPFTVTKCLLYMLGGLYLAGVYVIRGFGIAAGTHAAYDIFIVVASQLG
jgi:membrane protease YdiL (CAAX protease family)